MNKVIYILLTVTTVSSSIMAQKKINMDSIQREGAKTEFYEPVPPIVTAGKTPQDAPFDAIILFNGKDLSAWNADDINKPISLESRK